MKTEMTSRDAIIIGSGPNGLAAAIRLAQAGQKVLVIEGHPVAGGGTRTTELTEPGFYHDVCSAIHPMAMASPVRGIRARSKPPARSRALVWAR